MVSYAACHAWHVMAWRRRSVSRQSLGLALIFFAAPSMAALGVWMAFGGNSTWLAPCVVHALLAANYIAIYPALQASSPTLQILLLLKNEPAGLPAEVILAKLATSAVMADRVADLLRSELVRQSHPGGKLDLSWRGNLLATFFASYRQIVGLARGAG